MRSQSTVIQLAIASSADWGWTKKTNFGRYSGQTFNSGLGRVLDKSTRVQVKVLEKLTSTSTSTRFSKVLEYKYKYFEKYLSTSTEYFRVNSN